jgi:hypothetical protein
MYYLMFCLQAEAQEMEMVKISRSVYSIRSPKHEEKLREAASIHIKLGNIQRYCELMVEVGEVSLTVELKGLLWIICDKYLFLAIN